MTAVMTRTALRNKSLKHRTVKSKQAFAKQRNYSISLPQKGFIAES